MARQQRTGADFVGRRVGDIVRFVYPNAQAGSGEVIKLECDPRRKPLVIRLTTGEIRYAYLDQVEAQL